MPLRIILRKQFSMRLNIGMLPVYVVRCDEDFRSGWELFSEALKILEENAPIWWKRMPQLLKNIMLIDSVDSSAFYVADRCCAVNPWKLRRHVKEQVDAAIILAGFLVNALCQARLSDNHRWYFGVRERSRLSARASIRFLERCLTLAEDIDVQATINVLKSFREPG